jgi:hypothetical protein
MKDRVINRVVQQLLNEGEFEQFVAEIGEYLYHCFEAGGLGESNLPQLRDVFFRVDEGDDEGDFLVIESKEQFVRCVRTAFEYMI